MNYSSPREAAQAFAEGSLSVRDLFRWLSLQDEVSDELEAELWLTVDAIQEGLESERDAREALASLLRADDIEENVISFTVDPDPETYAFAFEPVTGSPRPRLLAQIASTALATVQNLKWHSDRAERSPSGAPA